MGSTSVTVRDGLGFSKLCCGSRTGQKQYIVQYVHRSAPGSVTNHPKSLALTNNSAAAASLSASLDRAMTVRCAPAAMTTAQAKRRRTPRHTAPGKPRADLAGVAPGFLSEAVPDLLRIVHARWQQTQGRNITRKQHRNRMHSVRGRNTARRKSSAEIGSSRVVHSRKSTLPHMPGPSFNDRLILLPGSGASFSTSHSVRPMTCSVPSWRTCTTFSTNVSYLKGKHNSSEGSESQAMASESHVTAARELARPRLMTA
mmetsp:Transcript_41768/g.124775  ORF Transcript_41768/g.124775 Transcript_41768/m.124775 type:complete len:257 (-) Transcript_41768:601-1371(-)